MRTEFYQTMPSFKGHINFFIVFHSDIFLFLLGGNFYFTLFLSDEMLPESA